MIFLILKFVVKYLSMTTLSSMSIINDNGIINYKFVFEGTKSSFGMF